MPDDEGRFTHAEAAEQLGVSIKTLASYRERGLIVAEVEHEGLNPRYWYAAEAIAACRQRLAELREQR